MLERPIRIVAVILSAIVIVSFALFAIDEVRTASADSRARIAAEGTEGDEDGLGRLERLRERRQSAFHEAVDDANDVVTAPFAGLVSGEHGVWWQRGVPALLALLVFGVGLGFLARYARGHSRARQARASPQ